MSLSTLPYDLLFNIAQYLTIDDIHHLQAACKSLRTFTLTRPVYRALAHGLLARSRPLPLAAFQRLSDLSTQKLIKAVDRAHGFERAWRVRAPRPARSHFTLSPSTSSKPNQWYTKISAPPNEEIDWLSPITSSYTLCATKSGRVICWDVARDVCLAEWDPRTLSVQRSNSERSSKDNNKAGRRRLREDGDDNDDDREEVDADKKWELWKCRVEFEERAVYFTMARVLEGSYDDNRVMEFVLMKLAFPPETRDYQSPLSQTLSFTSEPLCCSPSKSPANSPPPSSQASSPQDSTLYASATAADSTCSTRSPLSTRTASPLSDYAECCRDPSTHYKCACTGTPSQFMSIRGCSRASTLLEMPSQQPILDQKPVFFPLTSFHTTGVVMNVFLLDPPRRLLSAFVWVASSNTIGLYVLLDWVKDEYVFVDTGVGCLISSNWSCILHEDQIVIHSEEAEAAYQHFYPLNVLRKFVKSRRPSLLAIPNQDPESAPHDLLQKILRDDLPAISIRLSPMRSISKKFVFPIVRSSPVGVLDRSVTTEQDADDDTPDPGPSSITTVKQPLEEVGEQGAPFDDGSEFSTEDDDDGWSQEAVAESLRYKGKGRADSEEDNDDEPSPSSTRTSDKGKMREADIKPQPNGETSQAGPPSSSHLDSSHTTHSPSSPPTVAPSATPYLALVPPPPAPNPYPFPPWYPESAHFVRQWWPTLPGVPRLSCTVVLLASHDPRTHRTRFVLAQHYFRVPIVCEPTPSTSGGSASDGETSGDDDGNRDGDDDEMLHLWYVSTPFEVVCVLDGATENDDDEETTDRPRPLVAVDFGHAVWIEYKGEPGGVFGVDASRLVGHPSFSDSEDEVEEDELFGNMSDDGSVSATSASASASNGRGGRRRGHAHGQDPSGRSGSEPTNPHEGDGTIYDPRRHRVPKCLRFVTFPPVYTAVDPCREDREQGKDVDKGKSKEGRASPMTSGIGGRAWREEAVVRTLEIPDELDLDGVETINIDQSQGAVILSVKEGKIFILRYE